MDHGHTEIVAEKSPRIDSGAAIIAIVILLFLLICTINFVKVEGHTDEGHTTSVAEGDYGVGEPSDKKATHNDAHTTRSVLEYNSAHLNAEILAANMVGAKPAPAPDSAASAAGTTPAPTAAANDTAAAAAPAAQEPKPAEQTSK